MIKQTILTLAAILIMISCTNTPVNTDVENPLGVVTELYNDDNIDAQSFTIDNNIDNIITGVQGTIVRIYKNTFVDQEGNPVKGKIEIVLKEALSPLDRVLGNLTTTFENKPLETGGMIFIDALSGKKQLAIAADKSILIKMPTDSTLTNMSLFEGQKDSTGIKWNNPLALPKARGAKEDSVGFDANAFMKTINMRFSIDGFDDPAKYPVDVEEEVGRIAWEGDGLKISKDSTLKIGKYTVQFIKQKKLQTWGEAYEPEKGVNSFEEDMQTNYIFSVKKLGWANIDRLLMDPRTEEVELITSVENQNEFKYVYVTLITQKMYIPGYQKKDNSFCFSHGDEEKQELPVGESATILATAYKNDKPYFAIKKISIEKKQTVSFKLKETTKEKLKADLEKQI
jgi:hypothetical protein